MSTLLHKIGTAAFRKPWYFILAWAVVLGIVVAAIALNGRERQLRDED